MVARFDPHIAKLIEYWIPTQNRIWGNCPKISENNTDHSGSSRYVNIATMINLVQQQSCGIANVLQFSIQNHKQIWFTEWSENKIGKIEWNQKLPFSVETRPHKDLTVKRGETREIIVDVSYSTKRMPSIQSNNNQSLVSYISPPHLIVSGTFTPTGYLDNSSGFFDRQISKIPINKEGEAEIRFSFTPHMTLKPGEYTIMLGAANDYVAVSKALKIKVT
jgi:virginiamycin B lyase